MKISLETTKKISSSVHSGFSLIEVLVSLAIFAMVVTISVGSLMSLIDVNARARSVHTAMTNLSFMLDSMTREIRTGSYYVCGDAVGDLPNGKGTTNTSDCPGSIPQSFFSFQESGKSLTGNTPNDSRRVGYRLNAGIIERRLGNGDGDSNVNEAADWVAITDPNITISELSFYVTGSAPLPDLNTPMVTIYISGYVTVRGTAETFDIQTTVSQQLLDI